MSDLHTAFATLSTPLVADACLRRGVPYCLAPPGLRPVVAGTLLAGRVVPARHFGSVDVFLEAFAAAEGGVLVIDNGGRDDEGCIGDLTVIEAEVQGLAGLVVWGCHRDTTELRRLGVPVFSYGRCPSGPLRLDARTPDALESARFGPHRVTAADAVFADDDGAVFLPYADAEGVLETARALHAKEREQAAAVRAGHTLHEQLGVADYVARRAADPGYSFREHLRTRGGAIEE